MKCGPETISGAREMMTHRRRVESRINTAKENAQVRRNHVFDCFFSRGEKLFTSGFPRSGHEVRSVNVEVSLAYRALLGDAIDHRNLQQITPGLQVTHRDLGGVRNAREIRH